MQDHIARRVKTARRIKLNLAGDPLGNVALPNLPFNRRVSRVNTRTTRDIDLQRKRHHVHRMVFLEGNVKRIAGRWVKRKHRQAIASQLEGAQIVFQPRLFAAQTHRLR